jgi:hypothetical protein
MKISVELILHWLQAYSFVSNQQLMSHDEWQHMALQFHA